MKEVYNFCNPRGGCKCPKVYELKPEAALAVMKDNDKIRIGKLYILFNGKYTPIVKSFLFFSAMSLFIYVLAKTDGLKEVYKGMFAHITDEEKPHFTILFKK